MEESHIFINYFGQVFTVLVPALEAVFSADENDTNGVTGSQGCMFAHTCVHMCTHACTRHQSFYHGIRSIYPAHQQHSMMCMYLLIEGY